MNLKFRAAAIFCESSSGGESTFTMLFLAEHCGASVRAAWRTPYTQPQPPGEAKYFKSALAASGDFAWLERKATSDVGVGMSAQRQADDFHSGVVHLADERDGKVNVAVGEQLVNATPGVRFTFGCT